jgi:hypothetical protein
MAGAGGTSLSGNWTSGVPSDHGGTTIQITQTGTTIKWTGGPNDKAWVQEYTGTLSGSSFSGAFQQDAPGVTPKRYHGTISGVVHDPCHIELTSVEQSGQKTLTSVPFTKTGCGTTTTTRTASVGKIVGEVEFSTDGGKTFAPLTATTVLKDGDHVATGYASSVTLKFGHGTLTVFPLTQLRVDKYTDAGNIVKTQTGLTTGLVRVIEPHTAAIRSDFSVTTPTCAASIRGSGMVVSVSKSGVTTIYTTSDVSYVKGKADKKAITVRSGYMTTVGANKKATKPKKYTAAALKKITG